jgi:hypothetical protein
LRKREYGARNGNKKEHRLFKPGFDVDSDDIKQATERGKHLAGDIVQSVQAKPFLTPTGRDGDRDRERERERERAREREREREIKEEIAIQKSRMMRQERRRDRMS